jgi:hypothetical protein
MSGPTLLIVLGVLAVAVLGGAYWRRLSLPPPDPLVNMRCPGCRRKLHYRASRAGRNAQCPKCKVKFTYPMTPPEEENPAR